MKRDIVRLLRCDEEAERDGVLDVHIGLKGFARGGTPPAYAGGMLAQHRELLQDDETVGLVPTDTGLGHVEAATPAELHVAIAGTAAGGTPFVASWRVEATRRGSTRRGVLRNDEAHFLAWIACAP